MEERERARHLLGRLDLPDEAPRVLADSRYWTRHVCAAYLDLCDEKLFEDPGQGLPMARLAPTLVHLLSPSPGRDGLLVRALSVLGGALRATGSFSEAEGVYRTAFAIACRTSISPLEQANLHRRYVILCVCQGRLEDAEEHAQQAIEILTSAAPEGDGDDCLGAALVQRGFVHLQRDRPSEAAEDFGLALEALDAERNPRSHYAAIHNLAYALAHVDDPSALHRVSRHLRLARNLAEKHSEGQTRFKLLWVEAIVLRRTGALAEAEERFLAARDGLARLGAAGDMVRASIELALVYREQGRLEALSDLAEETLALCRAMGVGAEALAILATWRQAIQDRVVDGALLESVAERFNRRLRERG